MELLNNGLFFVGLFFLAMLPMVKSAFTCKSVKALISNIVLDFMSFTAFYFLLNL